MTEFEKVLQECLSGLERGDLDVPECLARHPRYAAELEPVLLTTAYLQRGSALAQPSAAFQARVRARLSREMRAGPQRGAQVGFASLRLAASLAILVLALLATTTVYAQRAMPGRPFYAWKLASETLWRSVAPDPVGTDLAIAGRRVGELRAISGDPVNSPLVLDGYMVVVTRLRTEMNVENAARILPVLESQSRDLIALGIPMVPPGQEALPQFKEPIAISTALPGITSEPPPVKATKRPKFDPTIEVPPPIR